MRTIREKGKPFTEEQMAQIFATNLIDFAVSRGYEIEKGNRYAVHVKHSGGLYFFNHGRGYYCHSTGNKGNVVDFVMEYFHMGKMEAMEEILGSKAYEMTGHLVNPVETEKKERGKMVLPEKAEHFSQTIAYLIQTRKIDKEIVYQLIKEKKIFQSAPYNNCCFVGYDEDGEARYCAQRGTIPGSAFKMDTLHSDKTYGFSMQGTSSRLYEFEAAIDAMSHATLCKYHGIDWKKDHRVAEGCLSDKALDRYLKSHPGITEIVFCYDNDREGTLPDGTPHNHGQVRAAQAKEKFEASGYKTCIQTPQNKDFNLDLKEFCSRQNSLMVCESEEYEMER